MTRPFRLMSFNIRYDTASDGVNAWPHRKDLVAGVVRRNAADVVGLQEVLSHQLDELRARLPDYDFVGVGRDDGKQAGEHAPLAWRRERFERMDTGTWWLSPTPDVPGSKGWDAALPRIATWAILRDRHDGDRPLFIVNAHLDHRGEQARLESARLLMTQVAAVGGPCVIMGDFNCTDTDPPLRELAGRFIDSYRLTHAADPDEGTFHSFHGHTHGPRIDFIFTDGLDVIEAEIDRSHTDGRYPSDHFPITAVCRIPD